MGKKGPGRPVDRDKQAKVLQTARELFKEKGFDGATMDEIAQRARVAKATLYNHYKNKEDLFLALILTITQDVEAEVDAARVDAGKSLRTVLINIGLILSSVFEQPDKIEACNILLSQVLRYPEIVRKFILYGPHKVRAILADVLEKACRDGMIVIDDSTQAAGYLISMWRGIRMLELQVGAAAPPTPGERKKHVTDCVTFFLKACEFDETKK